MKRHSVSKSSNEPFCLTREDVEAAFAFFDINGTGVLNSATLKARLEAFYPQLTSREYRFLLEDPEANTVNALSHSSTTPTSSWTANATQNSKFVPVGNANTTGNINANNSPAPVAANSNNAKRASTQTTEAAKMCTINGTAAANRTVNVPDIATAATNTCTAGNNSLNNTMNATMTTSAHINAPFDVEQLWRIIDTFQQEYMIPSGATSGDAVSNATNLHNLVNNVTTTTNSGGASNNATTTTNAVHRKSKPHDEREVSVQETNNDPVKTKNINESKSEEHASMSKKLTVASRGAHFLPSGETNFMFDPIQEAFQVYDPHHTNAVDEEVLSRIMASIGFGELSRTEISLLIRTADFDHDGKISLEDFRRLVSAKGRFQQKSDDKR